MSSKTCGYAFWFIAFSLLVKNERCLLAGLILNPAGTLLFDGSTGEDDSVQVSAIGSTNSFKFFGQSITDVYVAENGRVAFSRLHDDFITLPTLGSGPSYIAPLWDDFLLNPALNNSVRASYVPDQYLAVTWENVRLFNETVAGQPFPDTNRTAQAVWFEGDTTIRGYAFKKDDIAFGYIPDSISGPNYLGPELQSAVGLNKGDGSYSEVVGTTGGVVDGNNLQNSGLLAWESNAFLLFRPGVADATPDGFARSSFQDGYYRDKFFFTAVPEPSSLLTVLTLSAYQALRILRRKRTIC
jgi:hypothetical protein